MPEVAPPLTLAAAWLLGLTLGLTACTVSCLPMMGSWVFGRAQGAAAALRDGGAFLVGRIAGYAALGAVAGLAGHALLALLERGGGHLWLGTATLLAAASLLQPPSPSPAPCAARRLPRLPPLLLGAGFALAPCAPLAALVAAAAGGGDALHGAGLGLAFGLGAAVTPLLALLPALGALGRTLRHDQPWAGPWLRWAAGLSLAVLAGREFFLGVR
jgi:cytochrome c biogenesis protein CcdA